MYTNLVEQFTQYLTVAHISLHFKSNYAFVSNVVLQICSLIFKAWSLFSKEHWPTTWGNYNKHVLIWFVLDANVFLFEKSVRDIRSSTAESSDCVLYILLSLRSTHHTQIRVLLSMGSRSEQVRALARNGDPAPSSKKELPRVTRLLAQYLEKKYILDLYLVTLALRDSLKKNRFLYRFFWIALAWASYHDLVQRSNVHELKSLALIALRSARSSIRVYGAGDSSLCLLHTIAQNHHTPYTNHQHVQGKKSSIRYKSIPLFL